MLNWKANIDCADIYADINSQDWSGGGSRVDSCILIIRVAKESDAARLVGWFVGRSVDVVVVAAAAGYKPDQLADIVWPSQLLPAMQAM